MSLVRCEWPDGCGTMLVDQDGRRLCSQHQGRLKRAESSRRQPMTLTSMIRQAARDRPWVDRR